MVELYTTVAGEQLNFEGLFTMEDVFRIIDKYFRMKGFDKKLIFDEEFQTPKGKYFHIKAEYYKKVDSYIRMQTRMWLYINDYNPVEKEVEGNKIKTAHGKFNIILDAFLQTEYFGLFPDKKPFYFLFKVFYEKYMASNRIGYWDKVSKHVVNELKTELAAYLNLNKFLYER